LIFFFGNAAIMMMMLDALPRNLVDCPEGTSHGKNDDERGNPRGRKKQMIEDISISIVVL